MEKQRKVIVILEIFENIYFNDGLYNSNWYKLRNPLLCRPLPHVGTNRWVLFPTRKPFSAETGATTESQLPDPFRTCVEERKPSCDCSSALF